MPLKAQRPSVRRLLPFHPRASPTHRPGPVRGGDGGLCPRGVDQESGRPGSGAGSPVGDVPLRGARICTELDKDLESFRTRPLGHVAFPYLFCDATYLKGRVKGQVLGLDIGDSEDGAFWTAFLKGLRSRGLGEVKLVISDHRLGLKEPIAKVFVGASWQRCRVHFMRNALAKVPRAQSQMVAAAIQTIFAQADRAHVRAWLVEVAGTLRAQFGDVAAKLDDAGED